MIKKKRTRDGGRGKGDALARKAWLAEQRLRATSPEAKDLPPGEIRPTRAERRALLELQLSADGNEEAKRQADATRLRERKDNAERERLREGRKRPHKHPPTGLDSLTVVLEKVGERLQMRFCSKDTPGSETVFHATAAYRNLELMTPELVRDAAALRIAFDVERAPITVGSTVHQEIADAIRSAAKPLRLAWIPVALDLVTVAQVEIFARARGAADLHERSGRPSPPTTAPAIYEALVEECVRSVGFAPPQHVNTATIEWMMSKLAVGVTRGGGRTGRLSGSKMRRELADEKKLARIVPRPSNAKPM